MNTLTECDIDADAGLGIASGILAAVAVINGALLICAATLLIAGY